MNKSFSGWRLVEPRKPGYDGLVELYVLVVSPELLKLRLYSEAENLPQLFTCLKNLRRHNNTFVNENGVANFLSEFYLQNLERLSTIEDCGGAHGSKRNLLQVTNAKCSRAEYLPISNQVAASRFSMRRSCMRV